ncbi:unnamed protein product [Prorocentrum cordatum]|uniref:Uncharacterized protein n=1 Tax=Prorocentrum cordatum TaxID=2364126 RepID=A0ABN9SNG8_9DINO|nr:unnamed protein product [Polarella glacialis]
MGIWVLALPGSAWIGSSAARDALVGELYEAYFGFFAPASILLKYNALGPTTGLTHALPGAVWALLAPLQLSPEARAAAGGAVHRIVGRVMLVAAAVLMVGYAIIDTNKLYADLVDFAGHGGGLAEAADGFNAGHLGGILPPFNLGGVHVLAAWFIFSGVQTFRTATSRPRDLSAHRCWALRHLAAGLWVAAQRPLFAAARVAQGLAFGVEAIASDPAAQADAFYYCAYLTTAAYALAAEWAIGHSEQLEVPLDPDGPPKVSMPPADTSPGGSERLR